MMNLRDALLEQEGQILEAWLEIFFRKYSPESADFFFQNKDRFENPVGYIISSQAKAILHELLNECDAARLKEYFTQIIKVQAIQSVLPSQALGFIFDLKIIVRNLFAERIRENNFFSELFLLDCRIDQLAQLAFDCFMETREKIFHIKLKESRDYSFNLIKNINAE